MTFDLTNALAIPMWLMNNIFYNYLDKLLIIFLDDILVYSKTLNDYRFHLRWVLQVLKDNKLYAKTSKCEFDKCEVDYLDHRIMTEEIQVMSEKIEVIQKWTYENQTQLKSSLEFTRFYQRFMKSFSLLGQTLKSMLKKFQK